MKDKTTTALLALFLGTFGIHRFYLNQAGLGILYIILFFLGGVSFFLGIIDCICFLVMSEDRFNEKYNSTYWAVSDITTETSTNVVVNNVVNTPQAPTMTAIEEIKELYALKEKGIITEEEFQMKKKILL